MAIKYQCVSCGLALELPKSGAGKISCSNCHYTFEYAPAYLKYSFDKYLFEKFGKRYLLNKVLNNNAYLGYLFLAEGSLSCRGREDVTNFRQFITTHIHSGALLDVGCGLLEVPGYLDFEEKGGFEFFGIDPIDDRSFFGSRVVGCSELMPFADEQFDAVIFATSLDHVCSTRASIKEAARVLVQGGKLLVWMAEPPQPPSLLRRLRLRVGSVKRGLLKGYREDKFTIYPNWTVLYRPSGAVDPFHNVYEDPGRIISLVGRQGMEHVETLCHNKMQVFLCFCKKR
jgi:SAM-dependent methyltransferase